MARRRQGRKPPGGGIRGRPPAAGAVTLYRALVASGCGPPPGVTAQLERDAALIDTPDDFEALLSV